MNNDFDLNWLARLPEPEDVVARCDAYVEAHPLQVNRAVDNWLAKAAAFGVTAPAFIPLRPFLLAESLLVDLASALVQRFDRLRAAVCSDPRDAGLSPTLARDVGLLSDLLEPRLTAFARPDGFFDGNTFQLTEPNIGNGACVTAIEATWLNELYQEMGLFDAVPELIPKDPVLSWRKALNRRTNDKAQNSLAVIARHEVLEAESGLYAGQIAAFLERFLTGVAFGGLCDPRDDESIARIDAHDGVYFQLHTESMAALRNDYRTLTDATRRARWWLPPTATLLEKNVLPLLSRMPSSESLMVPETFWVAEERKRALDERSNLIFKSSINEKGVVFGDAHSAEELSDMMRLRELKAPLIAQARARVTQATMAVRSFDGSGQNSRRIWVESSPFLIDGQIDGVFCRCLSADEARPVLSPPPPGLGLGIAIAVRNR